MSNALLTFLVVGLAIAAIAVVVRWTQVRHRTTTVREGWVQGFQDRLARYRNGHPRIERRRDLSSDEKRLLEYVLCKARDTPSAYCDQIARAFVRAECECGCRSVEIGVEGVPPTGDPAGPIGEYWWRTDEGRFGLLVHASSGLLAGFEAYAMSGDVAPTRLPDDSELQRF